MGDEELNQSARGLHPPPPSTPPYCLLAGAPSELIDGAASLAYAYDSVAPPAAYNDRVVAFLRQPKARTPLTSLPSCKKGQTTVLVILYQIHDLLRDRRPSLSGNKQLREKVNAVRQEGTGALDRLQHDVEFTIMLR